MRAILVLLAVLWLAGCAQPAPEGLRMALASMPGNLDPRYATDAASSRLGRLLYAALTDFDDASRPVPALADWESLSPSRYRFRLRPGRAAFPDGRLPDAEDVAATYRSILDPTTGSPHRGTLAHIAAIETSLIEQALSNSRYSQKRAAELLGLTSRSLRYRLKKYDLGNE